MWRFHHIGHRLLAAVGLVVALGVVAVAMLYAQRQEQSILMQNESALTQVTDSAALGLSAIMQHGYADIAAVYAKRLKSVANVIDYRFLRIDGTEAFVDDLTIHSVNDTLGQPVFSPRHFAQAAPLALDRKDRRIAVMLARGSRVIYYEDGIDGERTVTVLEPIRNSESCVDCHPKSPPIRGMVKLTTSLKMVDADIAATWRMAVLVISVSVTGIFLIVWLVARRAVVGPIQRVTAAMSAAAGGDLNVTVPITGSNEIRTMADSFNQMSARLRELYSGLSDERDKLTTILLGAREGIVVTDASRRIVLINPAAIDLLEKPETAIVDGGFFGLVDNPEWMRQRLAANGAGGTANHVDYRGKTLLVQVSTIQNADGEITGSSALIRDVTDERRLAAELQRASVTDVLTGLYNRRHFDACLNDEFRRWKRFRRAFSIAMLDVDHFKKFNDAYGHECGDRVLASIGALLRGNAEKSAIACRYGGEELAVIFPEIGQDDAVKAAERLRLQIEDLLVDGLRVTVSIGVAGTPPQKLDDPASLLKLADRALYLAKQGGRNRVVGAVNRIAATPS